MTDGTELQNKQTQILRRRPPLSRGVVRMYGWLYFGCVWCPLPLILECLYHVCGCVLSN
jgi:hypothetical protein